jgi:tryptophan synthase alpha chain
MNALSNTFARLRQEGRAGLVTYTTAGDPDLSRSAEILKALDRAGADVLEVGVPFSDPLADGPVIQRATERALAAGGHLGSALELIAGVRPVVTAPIVVFSYANPLLRMGIERFARRAADAGVDGVLALDLPIEEAGDFRSALASAGLDTIFLLSPTTTDSRIRKAAELGRGFLYGISRLGVTGARDRVASGAEALVRRIRAQTTLPIALGFGISRPEHVAEVGAYADAAVVGSALVSLIENAAETPGFVNQVEGYVRSLRSACGHRNPATGSTASGAFGGQQPLTAGELDARDRR